MYKVEIITVVGTFIATTPEEVNQKIDIMGAVEWAEKQIAEGKGLELEDCSVLRIKDQRHIVAVRAFSEHKPEPTALEEPEGEAAPEIVPQWGPPYQVHVWNEKVRYLGADMEVTILATWDANSKGFFMLWKVNQAPASDFVGSHNFRNVVAAWLEQNYQYKGEFEAVVPHGTIDDPQEATEYLKDYVKETAPARKPAEKTGKAWHGYADDRGRK